MNVTDELLASLYSEMYAKVETTGRLYGLNTRRLGNFIDYAKRNIPIDSTMFEIGCGRGYMLRYFKAMGYNIEGTEIADSLLNPGGELYGLPVKKLFCSQLGDIPDSSYDAVLSSDVIEHVADVQQAEKAMYDFARMSRRWVLISTGGTRKSVVRIPDAPINGNIHFVIRPKQWWIDLFSQYCKNVEVKDEHSLFLFGEKK